MPITLKFANGNEVDIHPKVSTGLFTAILNGRDRHTRLSADDLVVLLESLRKITCKITKWAAIE